MSGRRRKRRQGKGGMESRTAAAGPGRRGASSQAGSEQPSRRRVTKEQVVRDLQAMTAFTDQDMNALERLFSVVIDLYHDLEPEVEAQMRADFDAEVMRIVSSITERTEGLANPFLRNSAFLLAKNELFEIIMIDILRYIKHELGRGDVEKVLGETVVARRSLTALFPQVVSSAQAYDKIEFKELQARNEELEREVFALQEAAQAGGNSGGSPTNRRRSGGRGGGGGGGGGDSAALRQEVATLRRERDELQRQLAAATAAGSAPSAAPSRSSRGRSSRGRGNTGRGGRRGQSRSAKPASTAPSGNESPAGRGSRGAGSGRGRSTPAPSSSHRGEGGAQSDGDMPRSPVYYPHLSSSLRKGKKPPKQDDDNEAARTMTQQERLAMAEEQRDEKWWFLESESFKRLTAPQPTPAEKAALAKAEEEARKAKRKEKDGSPKFVRKLTLKQLKVLIEEIYVSKQKYDHKCDTAELPYETMEQHVYTYLNQKYGLPSLINGWIDGIVEAVEEFQDSDPDVRCFGKILGCALHEGYLIEFHYNLKKKISQLLFAVLQIENPNVSHQEVSNLFHKRIAGSLTYEEWIYMVEDIYPRPEDQQAVLAQMMECIEVNRDARRAEEEAKAREETKSGRRSATLKARVRRRMTDEEEDENTLPFSDFVRIILNYQLDGHVRFLEDFREVFDEIWRNSGIPKKEKVPGVISDEDFVTLVRVLPRSLPRDKILQMLNIVDPFQKGRITFSQSASVLMAILKDVARQNEAVSLHGDDSYYDGDSQASFSRASDVSEEIDISR